MRRAYGFDLAVPTHITIPSNIVKKRDYDEEMEETNAKMVKINIEDNAKHEMHKNVWMHPSQVIAHLYFAMMDCFQSRQTFSFCHVVNYKNKNAFLKLWTYPHPQYDDNFVFAIEIESIDKELLFKWNASYTWGGSWFKQHLRLLSLFDMHN